MLLNFASIPSSLIGCSLRRDEHQQVSSVPSRRQYLSVETRPNSNNVAPGYAVLTPTGQIHLSPPLSRLCARVSRVSRGEHRQKSFSNFTNMLKLAWRSSLFNGVRSMILRD